jgi:hypothetical protein
VHKLKKQLADSKDIEKYRSIVKSFSESLGSIRDTVNLLYRSRTSSVGSHFPGDREIVEGVQLEVDLSAHYSSVSLHTDTPPDINGDYRTFSSSFYFILETTLMEKNIVFAEGSHFEQLIYAHRPPSMPGKPLLALGIRFSIDKLLRIAAKSVVFMQETPSSCDAIVVFHSKDTSIDLRSSLLLVTVLNSLRDHGLRSAHTLSLNAFKYEKVGASALKDVSHLCERLGIPYLVKVYIGASDAASDVLQLFHFLLLYSIVIFVHYLFR